MTTTDSMYKAMADEQLIATIESHMQARREYARLQGLAEMELQQRMNEREATVYPHPRLDIKMNVPDPVYDQHKLDLLREYKSPEECLAARIPEKVIPAKWNMVKVKPWLAEGDHIRAIIEAARLPAKPATLEIKEKKK